MNSSSCLMKLGPFVKDLLGYSGKTFDSSEWCIEADAARDRDNARGSELKKSEEADADNKKRKYIVRS